ncbi:MAG: hypothetical protein KY456_13675, partial [Chloroflexi bacterium]|nr:hypothetical protein [Chloroflexota bacterium]
MTDDVFNQLIADGWLYALLRVAFIALIYLFLFVVLRTTVRELAVAARAMGSGGDQAPMMALEVLDAAASSLPAGMVLALEPA